ncbi:MAG: hypothetical protein IKP45_10370 [Bacteroidales bacterium]|nr:hypothetical protein [Bacteroidales bacterium]
MLRKIWEAFKGWAKEAWHWLKAFLAKVWEHIQNWFGALRDYIDDLLEDKGDEATVLDLSTEVGQDIYNTICEKCPETTNINKYDKTGKMVIGFDKNHAIKKVENFQAKNVEDRNTDFDRDLADTGIIRMVN